jgi:mono/diheme cytochrome c family protein
MVLTALAAASLPALAQDPAFSAQRGERFFKATHGSDWSCASCHTENPLAPGRHAKTGKPIAPLAPAANPKRFTDAASVEKWFRRNCNDVLGRACTAQEKGDVTQYLMSLK